MVQGSKCKMQNVNEENSDNIPFTVHHLPFARKAFTIAEVLIAIIIMGIIATLTVKINQVKDGYVNKFMYYSAFINLKQAVDQMMAEGCTNEDITNGYCTDFSSLPNIGNTANSRGFCDRLADMLNTVGTTRCDLSITSPTVNATPVTPANGTSLTSYTNIFKLTNGITVKNIGYTTINSIPYYIVNIDIDGTSKRSSKYNEDVVAFAVDSYGIAWPYTYGGTTAPAYNTDYLTASVAYKDYNKYVMVATGLSYHDAKCTANGDYMNDVCTSPTQSSSCTIDSEHFCEIIINKPGW